MITKEQVLQNIENNKHVGDASPWVSAAYFMTGNGMLDSLVVNATAKETSFAFETALKTGIYKNHSVMGGNFLYNALHDSTILNLVKKKKPIRAASFSKKLPFGLNFNFLSNNGIKAPKKLVDDGTVKTLAERMEHYGSFRNATPTSEIVRTGFGIGKDYSRVFSNLRDIMGTELNAALKTSKGYSGWSGKNLSTSILTNLLGVGNGKFGEAEVMNVLKNSSVEDVFNFFYDTAGRDVAEKMANAVHDFKTTGKAIDKNIIDSYLRNIIKSDKIQKLQSIADDLGIKIDTSTFKGIKEATEKIGAFFTNKTTAEKILSSGSMKTMVGVASPFNAVAMAITAASIVASIGQDNAINNFISSHLYSTKESEDLTSSESIDTIYSASRIQEANIRSLSMAYSDVNTARRYMNDLDSISLDLDSYGSENFDTNTRE